MPSHTDLSSQLSFLEADFGDNIFTPATVTELEDFEPSIPTDSIAEEFLFYDKNTDMTNKNPTYTYPSYTESHNQFVASPTGSTQSIGSDQTDLLDLESFSSWDASSYQDNTRSDPDWTPTTVYQDDKSKKLYNNSNNNKKQNTVSPKSNANNKSTSPTKVKKRRSSSITSEIELQIEIEESTKRAKRCTVPLTEEQKRLRRKELNRLAAQRCRSKRKGHAELLEEEIEKLVAKNKELKDRLEKLETTKTELYDVIKFHFASCHSKSQ